MALLQRHPSASLASVFLLQVALVIASHSTHASQYGVDISFPIHHWSVSTNYDYLPHNTDPTRNPVPEQYKDMAVQPLGDRQSMYENWMQGCRDYAGDDMIRCDNTERERINMNLEQPQHMVNFTRLGFKKIKAPENVFSLLKIFWELNHENAVEEDWPEGYTYVNYWDVPTLHVSVDDMSLKGAGNALKKAIWTATSDAMEEWIGEKVKPSSLYGIRVYREGHFLATHVDRLPLVTSAIINVAQNVDEPWPLEVIGFDGEAYNITMDPGDMVLYESHSLLHGRPFPLKGKFFANIFVHFAPTDDSSDTDEGVPPYVVKGSPAAEEYWIKQGGEVESQHRKVEESLKQAKDDETLAHIAAKDGNFDLLKDVASSNPSQLHKKDRNGWSPLHEAARFGSAEIVNFLLEHGVKIIDRTNLGHTPLDIAIEVHGENHPVAIMLDAIGKVAANVDENEEL